MELILLENILNLGNIGDKVKVKDEVVDEVVSEVVPEEKLDNPPKKIDFQYDITSKAVVESIVPLIEDFSVENLMKIIPELIKHVETYKKFTGEQKRSMVISMLRHLVDITDGPGNDEMIDPIVKRLVPSIIDTLVDVDKGRLKLTKKKWKKAFRVIGRLFCCGCGSRK